MQRFLVTCLCAIFALGTAATLYRDMDMRFWLAQAADVTEAT